MAGTVGLFISGAQGPSKSRKCNRGEENRRQWEVSFNEDETANVGDRQVVLERSWEAGNSVC